MHRLVPWFVISMIIMVTIRGDPIHNQDRKDDSSMYASVEETSNDSEIPFLNEGPNVPSSLAMATARLMEELAKHGMSSSSPFALLLNSEASVWGRSSGESPAFTLPLAQAESAARSAVQAAWNNPVVRKARDAFAPCVLPEADLPLCLRENMLKIIDRAGRVGDVQLLGGAFTIQKTENTHGRALAHGADDVPEDVLQQLSDDPQERDERLDEIIAKKLTDLAASHVFTFRVTPEAVEVARSGIEEYRGKKGKYLPMFLMMALMMKSMLMHVALGTIALIAGKALTVGLMALVLSGVIGLKKLASHDGGGYEVVNVSPSHHHARHLQPPPLDAIFELPEGVASQHLDPYRAHAPEADEVSTNN